jgi:tRNA G18 (ribose-2'-O)-methylase SpoU
VAWRYRAEPRQALDELVAAGYEPVALETTARAVPLERLDWPAPVCLIVGNEVAGIGADLLDACPRHVAIPMRGVKDSLNVAVAFGIAAYHASRALGRAAAVDPRRRRA